MELYTGRPDRVIQDVVDKVREVIQDRYVVQFSIGRTNGIVKRRLWNGADEIIPVYKARNTDNATSVEIELLGVFYSHVKYANEPNQVGGGVSQGDMQYVYVAVWLAE